MVTTNVSPAAYLSAGKNRFKLYGTDKVYLSDGQEFSIELHNPTTSTVGAKVYINGTAISQRLIVLRPGQREWLDRHIESDNRFVFNTYTVDDTPENKKAIADNGAVRVEFFKEYVQPAYTGNTWTTYPTWTTGPIFGSAGTGGANWGSVTTNVGANTTTFNASGANFTNTSSGTFNIKASSNEVTLDSMDCSFESVETGRVEKGEATGQSFDTYYGSFEQQAFAWTEYRVLPESAKPVEISKLRRYCTSCGDRIRKNSWKHCPSCGEKID